jgi:hypothetical protein
MEDVKSESKATPTTDWVLTVMAGVLFLIVIALAVVITLPCAENKPAIGSIAFLLICLLSVILLLRQGKLAKLEFSREGIVATMAKVQVATAQAEKATKEVRESMKTTAASVLGLVKRSGRWGGYSYDEKEEIKKELLANLSEMGISAEEVKNVEKKSMWHEYVALDYALNILGGQYNIWGFDPAAHAEASELRRRPASNVATPDEVEKLLTKYNMLNDEARELIQDYRYYLEHHKQRRPKVWAERDKWYKLIEPIN